MHTIRRYVDNDLPMALDVIGSFSVQHASLAEKEIPKYAGIPGAQFYVGEVNGIVAGILGYIPDPEGAEGIFWAEWGYVHSAYRNQGIATALWDTIENELRLNGCRKLYIDIGNELEHYAAIKLYKERGYVKEGELLDFWAKGDHMVLYGKYL